jgi:co-chaperonin GroES (HSP10)
MSVIVSRFNTELSQADDVKKAIFDKIGSMDDIQVTKDHVLVAIYIAPEKTKGGIIRPGRSVDEDVWQGKVGLVLKYGPGAFNTDEFFGMEITKGNWVVYRTGDTWQCDVHGVSCRIISDTIIKMVVDDPSVIF